MSILIIGLALFLGIHSISIVTPGLRARAVAALGANAWRGIYSLISAAGFVLILYGFHLARQAPVVLYDECAPPALAGSQRRESALYLQPPRTGIGGTHNQHSARAL
jgi:uncharacterized membrane protein